MVWAILKCSYWLRGSSKFYIRSNQQALSNIYGGRHELENIHEVLRNLGEATLKFNFEVKYIKGTNNVLVDYLRRNPQWTKDG